MFRYALIDDDGIVYGVSNLTGEINNPSMILITDDFDLDNKKYVDGEWVDYFPEPIETKIEPTQLDRIEEAISRTQEEIKQEAIDNYTIQLMEEGLI